MNILKDIYYKDSRNDINMEGLANITETSIAKKVYLFFSTESDTYIMDYSDS